MELLMARLSTTRLKDLVRELRSCRTVAEERDVISRESAAIRTQFKEDDSYLRYINVSKLLYIHMIGYSSHFGQIECLKLAASPKFYKKRLGYLGVTLLVDNKEILLLITNSLKRDLQSQNPYVAGLALNVLGDIAAHDMAMDLYSEVEILMDRPDPYTKKKAYLCAVRLVKKVPSLASRFAKKVKNIFYEKDHRLLLTGLSLVTEICKQDPIFLNYIRSTAVKELVKHFENILLSESYDEYSINGVPDPFLQIKILQLFRILGKGNKDASDKMLDLLSKIATNANTLKNVVNSILYESVLTIMEIESTKPLKLLSINILGNLLAVKDNNIRYVALVTLSRIFANNKKEDIYALQQHGVTIIECLRDPDMTIRRRALVLSFAIINPHNIKSMTEELIWFIRTYSSDVKNANISRLCQCIDANNPDKVAVVLAICKIIDSAGDKVEREIIHYLINTLGACSKDVQALATYCLYSLLMNNAPYSYGNISLEKACFWCLGEYGGLLKNFDANTVKPEDLTVSRRQSQHKSLKISRTISNTEKQRTAQQQSSNLINLPPVPTEKNILDLICDVLHHTRKCTEVSRYAMNCVLKLSVIFTSPEIIETIKEIIQQFSTNHDLELQQRACEYSNILKLSLDDRKKILAPIPPISLNQNSEASNFMWNLNNKMSNMSFSKTFKPTIQTDKELGPLNDTPTAMPNSQSCDQSSTKNPVDLLKEIFDDDVDNENDTFATTGGEGVSVSKNTNATAHSVTHTEVGVRKYKLFSDDTLNMEAKITKLVPNVSSNQNGGNLGLDLDAEIRINNTTNEAITGFQFRIAVPKDLKVVFRPPGIDTVPAQGSSAQNITILNPNKTPLRMKVKIEFYTMSKEFKEFLFEYSDFDQFLWE